MNPLFLLSAAVIGMCALFAFSFVVARRVNNFGIVDIVWSYSFGVLAAFYAFFGSGWLTRKILIATMAITWSLRLGTHLYRRVIGHHPVEDGRYVQLRRDWSENFSLKMAGFFQMQAVSVVLLGAAFFIVTLNPTPQLHAFEVAGTALWFLALIGETLADAQLAAFKRDPHSSGRVCAVGLWRYSRHPNYFFEWLIWVAFFVFALASPWGWVSAIGPLCILYLLLRVTGIPLTEEQSLRSKGDAYRHYQKTTSAFAPWFPKHLP